MNKNSTATKTKPVTQYRLILFTALFFAIFDNISFFSNVIEVYQPNMQNLPFLLSIFVVLVSFIVLLFTLFSSKYTTKPIIITTLLITSLTNYFMNTYHVIIDESMLRNAFQTDLHESLDLFSLKMVMYFILLGVLPSVLVYRLDITYSPLKREMFLKLKTILISLLVIVIMLFSFSKFYTSFFREHKPLRYYTNPTYYIYSIGKYIGNTFSSGETVLKQIGTDATIENTGNAGKRKLVVMVVGEAARADRFSLNGYTRETNPLLKQEKIVNFSNMYSCGTSTAASVPCMFSIYGRSNYSHSKGIETENVLDVLKHTKKVDILWRDNNSNSKGVADRVAYEDFKNPDNNPIPDGDIEPRDTGMLAGLDTYIQKHKDQDILIVLHQMGNHGPAYYKRYPKAFEKFTPVCRTNQLEECSREEIANAYDNAILYTDYFLSKVIEFLKENSDTRKTAMIYMSDHGESLGENGLYLHGLPYFMAPDSQKHIAAFIWLGSSAAKNVDIAALKAKSQKKFSHDNLFHTLLGLFEVKTEVYDRKMDILNSPQ